MIIGHEAVLDRLKPLYHITEGAFLFYGPPSVGKRTVAFDIARKLLCVKNCGEVPECISCQRFNDHPDFVCVGRTSRVKVDDIENILSFVSTVPFLSRVKVVVIDNAEGMTLESGNRLLKILEEPPKNVVFFVVSCDVGGLLPTIKSRCVAYEFGALSSEDLTNIMYQKMGYELPKARALGWIAARGTVDIFAKAGVYLQVRDMAFDLLYNAKNKTLIDFLDYVDKIDRSDYPIFIDMLLLLATDVMLLIKNIKQISNVDIENDLRKMSEKTSDMALIMLVNTISQLKKYAVYNINLNMALKNAFIKIQPYLSK